jgi:hypothetical protein
MAETAARTGADHDVLILSASSRIRTAAPLNHRLYAEHVGAPYIFDHAPSTVRRIYLHKLDALRRVLPRAEWVFWIDDDAFFTDFGVDLRRFLDDAGDRDLVFCQSPVNPLGGWTWMSAGQFFIRRSAATLELLEAVADTDLEAVRAWWDHEVYGLFTNGDQDALVYQLMGPGGGRWRDRFLRLPWQAFNSRPYHYAERLDEHFICHFAVPGGRPKADVIAEFAERMGTTPALCDAALIEPYRVFLERSEIGPFLGIEPASPRAAPRQRPNGVAAGVRRVASGLARRARRVVSRLRGPGSGSGSNRGSDAG